MVWNIRACSKRGGHRCWGKERPSARDKSLHLSYQDRTEEMSASGKNGLFYLMKKLSIIHATHDISAHFISLSLADVISRMATYKKYTDMVAEAYPGGNDHTSKGFTIFYRKWLRLRNNNK